MLNLKIISLLIFLSTTSTRAAEVTCEFTEDIPPLCPKFTITSVTSPDEEITIKDQPTDYIDEETTSIQFISNPTETVSYIPTNLFKYFPSFNQFFMSSMALNPYEILSLTLVTDAFNYCEKLTNLNILRTFISHIPEGFAKNCKFLTQLFMSDCQIETIDENAFVGLESLETISLSSNQITCIPPLLFRQNLGLKSINFGRNQITALHPELFKGLTLLSAANFEYNSISYIPNFDLSYTATAAMMSSFSLNLINSSIRAIDPEFLSTFFYSRNNFGMGMGPLNLYFQSMNIYDQFSCTYVNGMPTMLGAPYFHNGWVEVDLAYKYQTTCYSNWNDEMANNDLVTCGTTNSQQSPVLHDSFRCYSDQEKRYTCVIKDAEYLISRNFQHEDGYTNKHVTRLYFVNSQLREVPEVIFDSFPNLNFLSIANTNLRIIDDKTFKKCGNLEYLDASNNDIIRVEDTAFRNCTSLKTIDLTGNLVDSISSQLYLLDPALESVYLNRFDDFILA